MDRALFDSNLKTLAALARKSGKAQVSASDNAGSVLVIGVFPISKMVPWNSPSFDDLSRSIQDAADDAVAEIYGSDNYLDDRQVIRVQDLHSFIINLKVKRDPQRTGDLLSAFEDRLNRLLGESADGDGEVEKKPFWKFW